MKTPQERLILVVDDTEATRYSVCRTLKHEGFQVKEAANGFDALRMVGEHQFDMVILDIHLPDILGFEVCKRIKADPKTMMIPVLQISASYVTSKDKIHGLEGGADSYLTHPVEPPVLIATVKALLRFGTLNQNLRINQEKLNMALEIAKLGTWGLDLGTGRLQLSSRTQEILGIVDEQKASIVDLIHQIDPADRFRFFRKMAQVRRSKEKQDWEVEVRYGSSLNLSKWLRIRGRLTSDESAPATQLMGTLLDITEPRLARTEIEKSRDMANELRKAAEAANQAKSQFLANMSHEIRTPLGAVLGYADLLLEDSQFSPEQTHFLTALKRNADLLCKLIEEVLDLSKVEADKMALEILRVSLQEILEDVVSVLGLRARERGIDLVLNVKNKIPASIQTDPTKLKQILINLIGNAIKFSDKGEILIEVELTSEPRPDQEIRLEIHITDRGIGISNEQQKNLFQPFAQADSSMSRRFGGTGLGLMLSQKLARLLGGDLVLANSEPGVGSRFTLTLVGGKFTDQSLDVVSRNSRISQDRPKRLENVRILVVEDSKDNQFMLNRFLHLVGAQVETADNGEEGVEKAMKKDYDLVLMDIQMPQMDGYNATKTLRSRGYQKPIVALTAHALKDEKENCFRMGFNEYMTKPVNRELLYEVVGRLTTN